MAVGDRNDPFRGFNFRLEIDGVASAGFSEVSGLTFDVEAVEYREGNEANLYVRKLPGLRKFGNITLKRGYTTSMELWEWYKASLDGAIQRRNGAVIVMDEDREDVWRWNFFEAWPTKYEGPTLNATGNEVIIETLELALERVELD